MREPVDVGKLERMRQQIQTYKTIQMGVMGVFVLSWVGIPTLMNSLPMMATAFGYVPAFLMMAAMGGITMVWMKDRKEFQRLYKEGFVAEMLSRFFENVQYHWTEGFSREEVRRIDLVRMGNSFSSEDFLRAEYQGVTFEQSDVRVKQVTKGRGGSHTTIYFSGRMFTFYTVPKSVGDVWVFSENFKYRSKLPGGTFKIQMEEIDFNSQFDVLASSGHDAFYLLTPPMMDRIRAMQVDHGNIALHFTRDRVRVAYNTRNDSFDADMRRPITYEKEYRKIENDIREIIELIKVLDLKEG